jgi:hypothetical protein
LTVVLQVRPAAGLTLRTVSGVVTDSNGSPVAGAHVGSFATETAFAVTPANGTFSFQAPQSSTAYDVQLLLPCGKDQRKSVLVNGDKTVNFTVPAAVTKDAFGYACRPTSRAFVDISGSGTQWEFDDLDDASVALFVPFTFRYYGANYRTINLGTNGLISFTNLVPGANNVPLPDPDLPNAALYPFWDDLVTDGADGVYTELRGSAPDQEFIIQWRNVHFFAQDEVRTSFEVVLKQNGTIQFIYPYNAVAGATRLRARGTSATIGIENGSGAGGIQQSFNTASIDDGMGIEFTAPK